MFVFFISFGTSATAIYAPYFLTTLHAVPPLATGYVVTAQSMCWTIAALLVAGLVGAREASDLVQDTYRAALESAPPRARERGQLRGWLRVIATRRAAERWRAERGRRLACTRNEPAGRAKHPAKRRVE